jgi:tetratricopeptide (TPR) repeat protein
MKHRLQTSGLALLLLVTLGAGAGRRDETVTDRETYNQGTARLKEQDFGAAEMLLFSAVSANDEQLQPTALYNLGLARFELGAEALAKGPDPKAVSQRAWSASTGADAALQEGLTALQRGEQQALIRAYLRGRGARRQVKEAMKALQEALNVQGNVLSRWQRASGDFHSTVELRPDDADAAHNADVVDRHIARLVDSIRQMQSMMQTLGDQKEGLEEMLDGLKGRIPDDMGSPGPGEEGEDWPEGPEPGMEEAKGREGGERPISPEDAQRLLDSFQLDRGRALPMGFEETGKPQELKQGRNW